MNQVESTKVSALYPYISRDFLWYWLFIRGIGPMPISIFFFKNLLNNAKMKKKGRNKISAIRKQKRMSKNFNLKFKYLIPIV